MPDFNPSNGLVRASHETTAGVARETGWHYMEFVDEDISPEYGTIDSNSISNNSQRPKSQPSKINSGGNLNVELDAEGHAIFFANVQKHSATPTNPGSGDVYVHKLAPSETDVDFSNTLTIEISRDDDNPSLNKGCRVNNIEVSIEPENFVLTTFGVAVERSEYYGAAVETSVSTTPVDPLIRGLPKYSDWILADGDVFVKVGSIAGAPNSITIQTKIGAAASFDTNTPITVPVATWTELWSTDATPERLGTRDIPLQIYWTAFTNVAANDTWRFDRERAVWTPVYPDIPKFNEIYASVLIDGTEYEIDQVTLTITRPAEPKHAIGGRHAKRIKERGRREVGGTFQREYLDVGLKKKLERAQEFELSIRAYSGEEIDNGYEHSIEFISKKCVFGTSKHATISGNDQMDESYPFTCHPSADVTYPDDMTIVITNTIADLTA